MKHAPGKTYPPHDHLYFNYQCHCTYSPIFFLTRKSFPSVVLILLVIIIIVIVVGIITFLIIINVITLSYTLIILQMSISSDYYLNVMAFIIASISKRTVVIKVVISTAIDIQTMYKIRDTLYCADAWISTLAWSHSSPCSPLFCQTVLLPSLVSRNTLSAPIPDPNMWYQNVRR